MTKPADAGWRRAPAAPHQPVRSSFPYSCCFAVPCTWRWRNSNARSPIGRHIVCPSVVAGDEVDPAPDPAAAAVVFEVGERVPRTERKVCRRCHAWLDHRRSGEHRHRPAERIGPEVAPAGLGMRGAETGGARRIFRMVAGIQVRSPFVARQVIDDSRPGPAHPVIRRCRYRCRMAETGRTASWRTFSFHVAIPPSNAARLVRKS